MQIVRTALELARHARRSCLAWGMFDGVHLGHQQVISAALTEAKIHRVPAVALTFDPHPLRVVHPDRAPRLLQPLSQRLRTLEQLGLDAVLVVHFDADVARQSGEAFVRDLVRDAGGLRGLSVGDGFQFGYQRSGDLNLLTRLGQELGFEVHVAPPVALGGEVVSSSRIRQYLREGRLDRVAELLGRAYTLAGTVEYGDQLGRQHLVPTANLGVSELELPPNGVYAVRVRRLAVPQELSGVLNLGCRPTLHNATPEVRFEVHLFDFEQEIYGEELEVTFVKWLREERKFEGLGALKAQILLDLDAARAALA